MPRRVVFLLLAATACASEATRLGPSAYVGEFAVASRAAYAAGQEFGMAMMPWTEGEEVDLNAILELKEQQDEAMERESARLRAIPFDHSEACSAFREVYFDTRAVPDLSDLAVAAIRENNPATPDQVGAFFARLTTPEVVEQYVSVKARRADAARACGVDWMALLERPEWTPATDPND